MRWMNKMIDRFCFRKLVFFISNIIHRSIYNELINLKVLDSFHHISYQYKYTSRFSDIEWTKYHAQNWYLRNQQFFISEHVNVITYIFIFFSQKEINCCLNANFYSKDIEIQIRILRSTQSSSWIFFYSSSNTFPIFCYFTVTKIPRLKS